MLTSVFLVSPTRIRKASSISMSEVPDHMSAGQLLPDQEEGSLADAGLESPHAFLTAFERLELECQVIDVDSDSDSRAPLFPYELGGVAVSGLSTKYPGSIAQMVSTIDAESSDEDDLGGVLIRDFAVEKDSRHEGPAKFPEYGKSHFSIV